MNDNKTGPGNLKVIYFFLGFLILFAFAFSLGVMVGKDLSESGVILAASEETFAINPNEQISSLGDEPGIYEEEKSDDQISVHIGVKEDINSKGIAKEDTKGAVQDKESIIKSNDTEAIKKEDTMAKLADDPSILHQDNNTSKELEKTDQVSGSADHKKKAKSEIDQSEGTPKDVAALPPIEHGGKYTVQVGSFKNEKTAKAREKLLKASGYPAFIKKVVIPEEGTLYRVRIGTFQTRKSAKLYGDSLKRLEPGIKFVYITFNY